MIAEEISSKILAPLDAKDTGEEALTIMNIYHVKHLPIVEGKDILGLISEEDILNNKIEEAIGTYKIRNNDIYVSKSDHLFEVMSKMAESRLSVIPVIDEEEKYFGLVTQDDLIQYFASSFSFAEPGSIVVIETDKGNYSLSEISQIVESEQVTILSSFVNAVSDSTTIYVTLKLNKRDIKSVIASLERYEFVVKASFTRSENTDGLKDRYDSLMRYLSV